MSIEYYNANGRAYFDSTVTADVEPLRDRFLKYVQPGGTILDGGCGSGRDAKAFVEAGYAVTAFDGSSTMAALAREHTGLDVQHLTFADVAWRDAFDGVWTCASLLHVARQDLPLTFGRLAAALRQGGAWYFSLKQGDATRHVDGRTFTDVSETQVREFVVRAGLAVSELWLSEDVRPGRSDRWINVIAQTSI